jgi:hypothetical protein
MEPFRLAGHNVIQLVYPLRHKRANKNRRPISGLLSDDWEQIYFTDEEGMNKHDVHNENIGYLFPSTYENRYDFSPYRNWIQDQQLFSYFHPSVQWSLFHNQDKKFKAFRYKEAPIKYLGQFYSFGQKEELPIIQFEWISSEIYTFSDDNAFLVIRLSLLENIEVKEESKQFNTIVHNEPYHSLGTWMKFVNRIRQNYAKFDGQPHLEVISSENVSQGIFFEVLTKMLPIPNEVYISNLEASTIGDSNKASKKPEYRIEANAFTHAFIQSDLSVDLSDSELYQIVHIDDYDGESGGTSSFKQDFIQDKFYRRWENLKTHYSAIDYGAVTITHSDKTLYENQAYGDQRGNWEFKGSGFPDILYQHHCRQYLFFILLQLYYREELQEIMGRYARIPNLDEEGNREKASRVLETYYTLNQFFFFDRITHEIQGMELWSFYQRVFGTKQLYHAVQQDMNELNQRLIERTQKVQEKKLNLLTVLAAITGMFGMNLVIQWFDMEKPFDFSMDNLKSYSYWIKAVVHIVVILTILRVLILVIDDFIKYFTNIFKKLFFR